MEKEQVYAVVAQNGFIAFLGTEADCWEFVEELPIHLQDEYAVYPYYSNE